MINLQPNRRTAATFTPSAPVTGGKTAAESKSFKSQLSEAASGSAAPARSAAPRLAETRQEFAAARQISAAPKLDKAAASATAEIAAHSGYSSAPLIANSGTGGRTLPGPGSSNATPPPPPPPPPMSPQQLVSNLLAQNAPPLPYGQAQQPSTDPAVYEGGGYMQQSNLNWIEQQANVQNRNSYANYTVAVQNWAENGMQGTPPAAPKYENVDVNGFNQWWSEYTSNLGAEAPPATFETNQPQDNGYGGAKMLPGFSV